MSLGTSNGGVGTKRNASQGQAGSGMQLPQVSAKDIRDFVEPLEKLVLQYPAAALATAFLIGVSIAWWLKRK